jgi:hypothetical protein
MNDIRLQVMWNRLLSVVEEQAKTLVRTAFSTSARSQARCLAEDDSNAASSSLARCKSAASWSTFSSAADAVAASTISQRNVMGTGRG